MPPESSQGKWFSKPLSPTRSINERALLNTLGEWSPRASKPNRTLPSTVRQANKDLLYSWNSSTKSAGGPLTSVPLTSTRPLLGASKPAIVISSVVLPQPDGPTKETNSPGSTRQEILPIAAVVSPPAWRKLLERLRTSRMGTAENGILEWWSTGVLMAQELLNPTVQYANFHHSDLFSSPSARGR